MTPDNWRGDSRHARAMSEQPMTPDEPTAAEAHHYVSTACQHGLHARCRRSCKFCATPCDCGLCEHAEPTAAAQPAPDAVPLMTDKQFEATAEAAISPVQATNGRNYAMEAIIADARYHRREVARLREEAARHTEEPGCWYNDYVGAITREQRLTAQVAALREALNDVKREVVAVDDPHTTHDPLTALSHIRTIARRALRVTGTTEPAG